MDPGRKRVEVRELEFVATGEQIITDEGVLWTVTGHTAVTEPLCGEYVWLWLERKHGDRTIEGLHVGRNRSTIKVRNNLTANS